MVNACGEWKADLEYVLNNFGDLRRQKDLYRSTSKTTMKTQRTTGSSRSEKTNTYYSSEKQTTEQNQYKAVPKANHTPTRGGSIDKGQIELEKLLKKRREQLYTNLENATGPLKVFERIHILLEIKKVEKSLESLSYRHPPFKR